MKTLIISLLLLFLSGIAQAAITERIIYAGDTPLTSDCRVTQTGPMKLTVMPCSWTTTGEARILGPIDSLVAATGFGPVAKALREGNAEWHHNRVRVWLRDKQGNIIEKSRRRILSLATTLTITAGKRWAIYLLDGPGVTMIPTLVEWDGLSGRPSDMLDYIVLPFLVPLNTIDLNTITIEVFTVRPDFPPAKGLFEK